MHKTNRVFLALLVVCLFATGCSGGGKKTSAATPSTSLVQQTSGLKPKVSLVSAGAEPRTALRLHVTKGEAWDSTATMHFGITVTANGRSLPSSALPPVKFTMHVVIVDVNPSVIRFDLTYSSADVVDDKSLDPNVVAAMRTSINQLVGLKGHATINDRGALLSNSYELRSGLSAEAKQIIAQFSQQASSFAVPLPEEPVGVGARWAATTNGVVNGIRTTFVISYVLKKVSGSHQQMDVGYRQEVPSQVAHIPALPAGSSANVSRSLIQGGGRIDNDLSSVLPTSSSLAAQGTLEIKVSQGARQTQLLERLTLDLRLLTRSA